MGGGMGAGGIERRREDATGSGSPLRGGGGGATSPRSPGSQARF